MPLNDTLTNEAKPIVAQNLSRFEDLNAAFEVAIQKPDRRPMGFREKLVHATKYFYERVTDRLLGINTPAEYDTGKKFIPSFHGTKYRFSHINRGVRESNTTVLVSRRHSGKDKLENEIQTTSYFDRDDLQKRVVRSTHNLIVNNGYEEDNEVKTQVATEGVMLPSGESLSRTQNFETGETTFRRHKGGLFQTWTFDQNHRLTESYEGRYNESNQPDTMSQIAYQYTPSGTLQSAVETKTTITPNGEAVQTINHPVSISTGLVPPQNGVSR